MKLTLSPMRHDTPLAVSVAGDVLTLNGEAFDFSALAEGDTLPQAAVASPWLAGDVTRAGGEIALALVLPHGANAPAETRFPDPITAAVGDGPVALPPYDAPPADPAPAPDPQTETEAPT